jgi:competence protein ComFB
MEMHNLMEDLVRAAVDEVCADQDRSGDARYCTTTQCRLDAICYVLNRIPPRYVSSGRGLAHLTADLQDDQQLAVDIVRLVHEGLHRVSAVRRGYYGEDATEANPPGACFNFPTIKGRILDGAGFMPLSEIDVELRHNDEPVDMFDVRWSNPCHVSEHSPGTYTFWPAPVSAERERVSRVFDFVLIADAPGYDRLVHHFSLELASDTHPSTTFNLDRDHHLPDLYLFRT